MRTNNTNKLNEPVFIPIQQLPPINEPIILHLYDKWRGVGNENETMTAIYDGIEYRTITDNKKIHQRFITEWASVRGE